MDEKVLKRDIKVINGLVNVLDVDSSLVVDLRYATENNFMKRKLYPVSICVLQMSTAKKLAEANRKVKRLGYGIKIYDAYRPLSVQRLMWDLIQDENFVAPPTRGSSHNRGAAVDVTLVDGNGNEALMPSDFDEFSERAWINYMGASKTAIQNRELLAEIMAKSGFKRLESEWWHFNDTDSLKYAVQDTGLEEFI